MKSFFSVHWFIVAALWYGINGLLHDIFIVRAHKGPYNRELLRLLMDGHVLILSGILMAVCWYMARAGNIYGPVISLVVALGMIVYCAMIFPFLKSLVTLGLSVLLVIISVGLWVNA
jgi:hypothetical protein